MKHKLRIWQSQHIRRSLWYVECQCGWEPQPAARGGFYGRATFPEALATGIEHHKRHESFDAPTGRYCAACEVVGERIAAERRARYTDKTPVGRDARSRFARIPIHTATGPHECGPAC